MGRVLIEGLYKKYAARDGDGREVQVLRDLSLRVEDGEFVVLFGPNGCGKTTILNVVAGIVPLDAGRVHVEGRTSRPAEIGYVYQQYHDSLFPWRTNIDNVAFPLELKGIRKTERRGRAHEFLKQLSITIPEHAYPYQLSGGQQRLLSITRALIAEPDVLLMDEPFDGLDYFTRLSMQTKLLDLWQQTRVTTLFISHDLEEAIFMANRLLILTKRPASVYREFAVDITFPRSNEVLESERFTTLRRDVLAAVREVLNS